MMVHIANNMRAQLSREVFFYLLHACCMRESSALARLRECAVSTELCLLADTTLRTNFSATKRILKS